MKRKRLFFLVLAMLVVWGGVLRFYGISRQSLWIDEAASVLQCRAILESGVPRLADGTVRWDAFPATYLQAAGGLFSGDPHWGMRVPAALAGCLCIVLAFLIVRDVTGLHGPALLSAAAVAFFREQIIWSRQVRPYIFVQTYGFLAVFCVLLWRRKRRAGFLAAAVVFSVLAAFCHRAGYLVPLTTLALVVSEGRRGIKPAFQVAAVLCVCTAAVSLLAPASNSGWLQTLGDIFRQPGMNYWRLYAAYGLAEYGWLAGLAILSLAWPKVSRTFAAPLLACCALYFLVLSFRTWLYAERYAFLFCGAVALLFPMGVWALMREFTSADGLRLRPWVLSAAVLAAMLAGPITVMPRSEYDLGPTVPAPPWRDAYAMILDRQQRLYGEGAAANTVSPYPALHDIYLGKEGGKGYLPINMSGRQGDVWGTAPFTRARVVETADALCACSGYALLDDFGLRMLASEDLRRFFAGHAPNAVLRGRGNVYIWILNGATP